MSMGRMLGRLLDRAHASGKLSSESVSKAQSRGFLGGSKAPMAERSSGGGMGAMATRLAGRIRKRRSAGGNRSVGGSR